MQLLLDCKIFGADDDGDGDDDGDDKKQKKIKQKSFQIKKRLSRIVHSNKNVLNAVIKFQKFGN